MIRKRVCEEVRKTGEQQVYEADERGKRKTLGETTCATCQSQQVCTQVPEMKGSISRIAPFQVLEVGAFAHKERIELFLHLQYTGPVEVDGFPRLSVR